MRRRFSNFLLYLYVWMDVSLFMTAERINAAIDRTPYANIR